MKDINVIKKINMINIINISIALIKFKELILKYIEREMISFAYHSKRKSITYGIYLQRFYLVKEC